MKPKLKEGITIFKNEITALGICLTYETLNNLQYDFIYTHTFIGKNHISGTIPKSPEQLQIKADFEYEKLAEKLIFWNIRSKDDESIALSPEETTILFNCTKLANISLEIIGSANPRMHKTLPLFHEYVIAEIDKTFYD